MSTPVAHRTLVLAISGAVLAFAVFTMVGWVLGRAGMVQWLSGAAPTTFNAATCFALAGAALLALCMGMPRAACLAGAVLTLFGTLLLSQYVFDVSLGLDEWAVRHVLRERLAYPGRLAPATAFTFMLLGCAAMLLTMARRAPWWSNWVRALACMAALLSIGTLAEQVFLRGETDLLPMAVPLSAMAPQTAVFLVVLAMATWAAAPALRAGQSWLLDQGAPWLCSALACAVFVAWVGFKREEWRARQADVQLAHESLTQAVRERITERAAILSRLAQHHPDGLPDLAEWDHAAGLIVRDYPTLVAVALVDTDMVIRSRVSRDARRDLIGASLAVDAERLRAYAQARSTGRAQLTAPIELRSGGFGVAFVVPVLAGGKLHGYVAASIRGDDLRGLLSGQLLRDFGMSVADGASVITREGTSPSPEAAALRRSAAVDVMGRTWTLDVWPREHYMAQASSRLPGMVLIGGLLVVLLIAAAFVQARRGLVSARRLARTLESITDGFLTLDRQWRFTYLNPVAERLLQTTRDQVVGRAFGEAFPQAVGSNFQRQYERAMATGSTVEFEDFYPPLDKWFAVRAYPSAEGLALYFQDITATREQRMALQRSEERFRLLARAAHDVVWDWDLTSPGRQWGETFASLFGADPAAAAGPPDMDAWRERIHPDDRDQVVASFEAFRESIGHAVAWEQEYRFRRADGSMAWVLDRAYPIHDVQGKPARMVGVLSDVTEQHALREQLQRAQRLESVGQLTGGVAHDFNNMLTVIMGNAELLEDQLRDQHHQRQLASLIVTAAQRGADLTQRLLAFARKQALAPRAVRVDELVAGMDPLLRRTLGEHVRISLRADADLWLAQVDPSQLESALLNLALNARDAMPDGGELVLETCNTLIDVEYATANADVKPGEYVLLAVSDTGVGIPPAHLPRLFEPFFTTKEKGKGTGLGLPMVYGFVKQSGGHVSVYSEVGEGTTVKIYLPRARQAQQDAPVPRETPLVVGGGETVLVVEDDELVRAHATQLLRELGYQVLQAGHAQEALELLRAPGPHPHPHPQVDLLFTDVVMPGMSGRQLAQAVHAFMPSLPVLFTSGYTDNAIIHHGRLDPGVRLLSKPYRRAELAQAVRAALDAARGEAT